MRVAGLRADYIRLGIAVAAQRHPSAEAVAELAEARAAYEELAVVFDAAERVIERGYVDLA